MVDKPKDKILKRYNYHDYIINPLAKSWSSCVKSLSLCYLFIARCLNKIIIRQASDARTEKRWKEIEYGILKKEALQKQKAQLNNTCMFLINRERSKKKNLKLHHQGIRDEASRSKEQALRGSLLNMSRSIKLSSKDNEQKNKNKKHLLELFRDGLEARQFKEVAIMYFLIMASREFMHFMPEGIKKKHTYRNGELLFSKTRWQDTSHMYSTFGNETSLLNYDIQPSAPVMDSCSPISISICLHFHREVSKHRGVDQSFLLTLSSVYIFGGQKLMKELVQECAACRIKLKKRFYQEMGPLSQQQLTFGSVNRYTMLDMSGHYITRAGLNIKETRATAGTTKTWLLHSVCLVSNYSMITVLEDYSTESFVQAIHRLGCLTGYPEIAWIDNSHTEIKGMIKTKFNMMESIGSVYAETGITIKLCGSGGNSHSRHGRIERRIGLAKKYFAMRKVEIGYLTPIGLDTLAKQAANFLNSLPMATKKRHGCTMTAQLVTPFTFLIGRGNGHRAPSGSPEIEENRGTIMRALEGAQKGMLEYFVTNLPDLLLRTTWEESTNQILAIGDCVLFQKDVSLKEVRWHLGVIQACEEDEDGISRIFEIAYTNASEIKLPQTKEDKTNPKIRIRYTRKGCHTLVKLFDLEDHGLMGDISQINNQLKKSKELRNEEARDGKKERRNSKGNYRQAEAKCPWFQTKMKLNEISKDDI